MTKASRDRHYQGFSELFSLHCDKNVDTGNRKRKKIFRHGKFQHYHLSKRTQIRLLLNKAQWKHHLNIVIWTSYSNVYWAGCIDTMPLSIKSGHCIFRDILCMKKTRILPICGVIQIISPLKNTGKVRKNARASRSHSWVPSLISVGHSNIRK